jgi:hypothetical protein
MLRSEVNSDRSIVLISSCYPTVSGQRLAAWPPGARLPPGILSTICIFAISDKFLLYRFPTVWYRHRAVQLGSRLKETSPPTQWEPSRFWCARTASESSSNNSSRKSSEHPPADHCAFRVPNFRTKRFRSHGPDSNRAQPMLRTLDGDVPRSIDSVREILPVRVRVCRAGGCVCPCARPGDTDDRRRLQPQRVTLGKCVRAAFQCGAPRNRRLCEELQSDF